MHILDPLTATQLAAGATIDRPAAVVRELLDNAIDAGAGCIRVHVEEGRITVADDGCGMSEPELLLAFQRHATSKLQSANDTVGLQTLGFRGEALAAIAAVAALTAVSRRVTDDHGVEVRYAAGELHDLRACAAPVGTTVSVERLFYTTPHRRLFWRQPMVEAQRIADMVMRYALCYPAIAFACTVPHTDPIQTSGSGVLAQAILEVWLDPDIRPVAGELVGYPAQVTGAVGGAHSGRPMRRRQIVAINQRPIAVRGAVAHLIDEVLPPQKQLYPACVLSFAIPADSVDVNSREGKEDVLLRSPSVIARLLYQAFRAPLQHPAAPILAVALPPLTVIGVHHEWIVASGVEGIYVLSPANIMQHCGVTTLARGAVIVPPYPIAPAAARIIAPHQAALAALGFVCLCETDGVALTALPAALRECGAATAVTLVARGLRAGLTPAQAVGALLDPEWLIATLRAHPDPWSGNTCFVVGHHRIQQSLRRPNTAQHAVWGAGA